MVVLSFFNEKLPNFGQLGIKQDLVNATPCWGFETQPKQVVVGSDSHFLVG